MRTKRVLIVDDERRMADSLRELLTGSGYHAHSAYDGAEALAILRHESFHVVVTDLRMWGVDGLTLVRHIHENHPRTLVIVITGHATTESAIESMHYQVFDYLRKPFDFDLFRMAIEKAFHRIESDQLREDTAAMITHDIKIPLTSIIGFAAMLYDREREEYHPRAREFSETIQVNGQKILNLIENYLTTCKINAGTLRILPAAVDVRRLMQEVVETATQEASRRGHEIFYEIDESLSTADIDEALVYRAVGNMLNNAIKYGQDGEAIEGQVRRIEASDSPLRVETIAFEIQNRVMGLKSADLLTLFQRYERIHGRSRIEGSGIGLYVVKAIATAHGGDATAELVDEHHVRFRILLPMRAVRDPRSQNT